jgi:protease-4
MSFAQVDSIAQGRVWTGSDAIKIGLVDKIGGLNEAINEAAKLSKIKSYTTKNFPEYEKDINDLLENLPFAKSKDAFIKEELGVEAYAILQRIKRVQTRKGIQAAIPYEITIH